MEDAIYALRDEVQALQHAPRTTREEEPQYDFSPLGSNYSKKETKWTITAPTERCNITGTDTGSEIISTITTASNLWREEMSVALLKTREHMLCMERNHTKAMLAMQHMTDERFSQGTV